MLTGVDEDGSDGEFVGFVEFATTGDRWRLIEMSGDWSFIGFVESVVFVYRPEERGYLHEIWPGATNEDYFHDSAYYSSY